MFPEVTEILPHRPPMVMIDALVECGEDFATSTKIFEEGDYGVEGSCVLEPVLIECLAQTVAAMKGMEARKLNRPLARGMLVGVERFEFHSAARPGCRLDILVRITRQLGPFVLAEGTVKHDGKVIAEGGLKFYVEENASGSEETPQAGG